MSETKTVEERISAGARALVLKSGYSDFMDLPRARRSAVMDDARCVLQAAVPELTDDTISMLESQAFSGGYEAGEAAVLAFLRSEAPSGRPLDDIISMIESGEHQSLTGEADDASLPSPEEVRGILRPTP